MANKLLPGVLLYMHDLSEEELLETIRQLQECLAAIEEGLSNAVSTRNRAESALANEAGKSTLLFDMWLESKSREEQEKLAQDTLDRANKILAQKRKPDDREEILAGAEFGVVFIPTQLLRQLWGLGEAVVNFQTGKAESKRVEMRALEVMMLAGKWVVDAQTRWGTPERVEKTNVGPLTKEEMQADTPF